MPIYEFKCNACGHEYEELVFDPDEIPACPTCGSDNVERLMSMFEGRAPTSGFTMPDLSKARTPEMLKDTGLHKKLASGSGSCGSSGG
ncbi:FmdB family zinc ribbon protein [Pseudodesulfovibrio tunisiensis]|uniref:FmdB family zinc ribbon protein n=1 Tax=Pseudodesulfovibrio tunisiensis TaxID=463192 RepID=UPI001FB51EE9|nr:zinc ribbon domain-containing protein [Pseudodesulfovibrio tunisiensis]